MKFMALYMAPAASIAEMMQGTEQDMKDGMAAWNDWSEKNRKAIDDMGAPLGKTRTVSASGVKDTKNEVTGFSIVEADSHDAAAKMFAGHPHLQIKGATIDIMNYVDIPGM
jgi:hypothetical protein